MLTLDVFYETANAILAVEHGRYIVTVSIQEIIRIKLLSALINYHSWWHLVYHYQKNCYSEKDFNNANASVNVPICSSLVKTIPIGNATATECVQKIKTRMLCWYIFEDESTKISSDDSCIYNELLTIRKVSFYKYWINERKYEGISDIYHFTDTFFRLVYWFRQVKFAELNFIFSTMPL